ncbi:MAG: BspA family leucine-rich repeat surface protein [Bacteroidales bacterium]|nr:BspA family leucine-rich repeat surface protein [Bacteroidales bacterium]
MQFVLKTVINANPDWVSYCWETCTCVVFDSSFAQVCPASFAYWFNDFGELTTIEGMENINTSEATLFKGMFQECSSIETLNVDGFDVSKAINTSFMFYGCTNLKTIYCSNGKGLGIKTTASGVRVGTTGGGYRG